MLVGLGLNEYYELYKILIYKEFYLDIKNNQDWYYA